MTTLVVELADLPEGTALLAPAGMTTPHDAVASAEAEGGRIEAVLREPELDLAAVRLTAEGGPLRLYYRVTEPPGLARYPEAMFIWRGSRFTEATADLGEASRAIAISVGGGAAGIEALVAEAEARFAYAHPEVRFNDATDAVPYLSCGVTPGSCVDINTYLVASLRAAGYEAGYIYGYFFPEEKGGITHDMHCWVVTRHGGETLEWDVAHHMKAGLGPTVPGLNPRPGRRVALGHSMGHRYPGVEVPPLLKLLAEPLMATRTGEWRKGAPTIRIAAS